MYRAGHAGGTLRLRHPRGEKDRLRGVVNDQEQERPVGPNLDNPPSAIARTCVSVKVNTTFPVAACDMSIDDVNVAPAESVTRHE